MPRTLRVEYPGAIYHVMNRGDCQVRIFLPYAGFAARALRARK